MILEFFFCVFVSMFFFLVLHSASLIFILDTFSNAFYSFRAFPKQIKSLFDNNWRVFQSLIGRIAFLDLKFVWVNQKIDEIRFKNGFDATENLNKSQIDDLIACF